MLPKSWQARKVPPPQLPDFGLGYIINMKGKVPEKNSLARGVVFDQGFIYMAI